MNQDITFCGNQCEYTECSRHSSNIKDNNAWHSFALLKDTEDCEREKYNTLDRNNTKEK